MEFLGGELLELGTLYSLTRKRKVFETLSKLRAVLYSPRILGPTLRGVLGSSYTLSSLIPSGLR